VSTGGAIACSVIIPTYNRAPLLANTLTTLAQQSLSPGDYEVIVVDDGSTDGTRSLVSQLAVPYPLRYIAKRNTGSRAATRNAGIRIARGEVLTFVDAEMLCPPRFLEAHLGLHARYGPCAVCGWDRRLATPPRLPLAPAWEEWAWGNCTNPDWVPGGGNLDVVPFITSDASCRRVDAIEAGLFDEAFTGYGHEDLDLGMRLYLLGRRIVSAPQTAAFHQPHPRASTIPRELDRNSLYYTRKHHRLRNIVHCIDGLACGGAERFLVSLARRLHGRQHSFTVVIEDPADHFVGELADCGVPVVRLPGDGLAGFLAATRPHAVHVHFAPTRWLPRLLRMSEHFPALATLHVDAQMPPMEGLDLVVCPSYGLAAIQPGPPAYYRTVWLGTDLGEFAPRGRRREMRREYGIPADAVVYGTAARLDDVKLTPTMLGVCAELVRARPNAYVLVFGEGLYADAYRAWIATEGLADRILLPGVVKDMAAHLEALDVCLHAVENESFGLAPLEAMAMGLPVVAPAVGGLTETVEDGVSGLLCRDEQELLAAAVGFADGTHDARAMGYRAKQRARAFDERRTAFKYKLVYDELIDGARYSWPWPSGHCSSASSLETR